MTPSECVNLVRLINARCPSMRLDDHTPDAWYIDLASVDITDAREAAITISRRQAYIALHELLTEAASINRRRIGAQRAAELKARVDAENPPLELHPRPVAALEVGQPVPRARILAQSVAAGRKPAAAIDTEAAAAEQARRDQARAEVEQVREKAASE